MNERLDRRRLLAQIQAGDRQVVEELYGRYFDRVHTYMCLMLEDEAEAHAATQTAFRMALSALPGYRFENGPFEVWLCRFVHRAAEGRVRGRDESTQDETRAASTGEGSDEAIEADLDLKAVADAEILRLIPQLPPSERELVILHYMWGLSPAELTVIVERDADEVRGTHKRALARLSAMLSRQAESGRRCSSGAPTRRS